MGLPDTEFMVGRSLQCDLSLDDELVSRRHAMFRVDDSGVSVEDLQSCNGVLVNGDRIVGKVPLRAGDRITIGSQEFVLIDTGAPVAVSRERIRTLPGTRPVKLGGEDETALRVPDADELQQDLDTRSLASVFALVGAVAERALGAGHLAEAERIVTNLISGIQHAQGRGRPASDDDFHRAIECSLDLAARLPNTEWLERVFELHESRGVLPSDRTLDAVRDVVAAHGYASRERFEGFAGSLRRRAEFLGPSAPSVLRKLDEIHKLATR